MSKQGPQPEEVDHRRRRDASAAPLRAVAEAVQDAIICVDAAGTIMLWLGGAERLLGWTAEEAVGRPLGDFVPAHLRPVYVGALHRALAGERADLVGAGVIEIIGLRRDGTEFPAELTLSLGEFDGEPFLVAVIRDAGGRRAGKIELALARSRFRSAFEHAATGMAMAKPDGRYLAVNDAFCALVGRRREELERLAFSDITHPGDQEADLLNVARLMAGEVDYVRATKRYVRPDGSFVWVEGNVSLVRDDDGRPLHYLIQVIDVTELRRTAEELERSNSELAHFAAVAAHDLNEPLRIVEGFLRLLETRAADTLDDDGRRFVDEALGGAQRMRGLIDALLRYARVGRGLVRREAVDLEQVAREAEGALATTIWERGTRVEIVHLPTVDGDAALLRQVLQNLLANAVRHAEPSDPRVAVTARETEEGWELSVADNGPGVPADLRSRAFDLFEHGRDGGTGLGLAICRRAVERHGGRIWIADRPGGGADVRFLLPVDSGTTEAPQRGASMGDPGFEPGTSSLSEKRSNRLS
jgi:PAS domain S-box-containing protein